MQRASDSGDDDTTRAAPAAAHTIALVCGDPLWEHAISWLIRSAGIEVVGHARDVDRALDVVVRADPRVLVVDADEELEPSRLLRRVREVKHVRPSTRVVVVCSSGDNAAHDAALAAGAEGVVWRENAFDLLRAVETAVDGDDDCEERPQLTLRELEVLRLVAEGRTNREVARAAWVTEQTVKYHLANIYRRLGVCGRSEAVTWAAEQGIVDRDAIPAR